MAKAKYISEFERDVIRIGIAGGVSRSAIARFLGRSKQGVAVQVTQMADNGTLDNLPLGFVVDELQKAMRHAEA